MAKLQGGTTVYGSLSASGVIYASGGNSDQWNSVYTTVSTASSSWSNKLALSGGTLTGGITGTTGVFTVSLSSPALSGVHYGDGSKLTGVIASGGTSTDSTKLPLSGGTITGDLTITGTFSTVKSDNWQSTYTTVCANSTQWAVTTDNTKLALSGGTINGNLLINGSLTALSGATFINTTFQDTSALRIFNSGLGPALYVEQASGSGDIAKFYDADGIEVLHVGNALNPESAGVIGIKTSTPNKTLTINGEVSAASGVWASTYYGDGSNLTNVIASGGVATDSSKLPLTGGTISGDLTVTGSFSTINTDKWQTTYSTVCANSAQWAITIDTTKLPLSGGTLTGKLFGNDADFSNSLYATTISATDFYGNGSQLTNIAKLDSPAFVGIPTAPTASANTNTTQIATTQFVIENGGDRYLTTSNSTLTINNNNNISLTAAAGLSYITGQDITIVHSPTQYINATVVSYNKTTGVMVYNGNSNLGSGTFNTWTINVGGVPAVGSLIASNNLSDVASTSASLANLGGFPATGGALNGGLTGTHAQFNSVTFTPNAVNLPYQLGKVWYDTNKDALCYYNSVSGNKLHIGQEIQQYVRNATANTILKGDVVRIIGFTDQSPDVVLAQATSLSGSIITGFANQDIPPNTNGYIVTIGELANYDTSRFTAGEDLFLSPLSAGKITNILPTNPYFAVQVGVCMYSHSTNGKILIYTQYLGTAANTVVGTLGIEQLPTTVGSTVSTVSSLSARWESVYTTVSSNSSTYATLTGTQTLKNKTVVDWMTLVRGYNTTPTLFATIGTGDVYAYVYNSSPSNITYYRFIATDGSTDAFYTSFNGTSLSGLVASKSIAI